jgi:nitrite reductase/ring-hydroxylating ferredoxin subunit
MAFRRVAALDELWHGEMIAVEIEGQVVSLVNVERGIHAYADSCPHLRTRLSQGSLQRNVLTCSIHRWEFDASTAGGSIPKTACLESFAVGLENGDILIDVDAGGIKG